MSDSLHHPESAGVFIVITELQGSLVLTFPAHFTYEAALEVEATILTRCAETHRVGLIFDLSALEVLDLTEWRWLRKVASEARLLGARSWFVGISPPLVASLVMLDADIDGVDYALGVEHALAEVESLAQNLR